MIERHKPIWTGIFQSVSAMPGQIRRRLTDMLAAQVPSRNGETAALVNARRHLHDCKARESVFGRSEFFGDPAWNMLVELFIAHEERRDLTAGQLCGRAGAALQTAHRWLAIMEREGLVMAVRATSDEADRQIFISPASIQNMHRCFGRVPS
jgi:hypothetical protein